MKIKKFNEFILESNYVDSLFSLISLEKIPLIPSIVKMILSEDDKKITSFHISSSEFIDNMKKIIGKRNTISSFLYRTPVFWENLRGMRTRGGIFYCLEGTMVFNNNEDMHSSVDISLNRKWIDSAFLSSRFNKEISVWVDQNKKNKEDLNYIKSYLITIKKLILKYHSEIKNNLINIITKKEFYHQWNEILIKNIVIKNILYSPNKFDDKDTLSKLKELCNNVEVEVETDISEIKEWFIKNGGYMDQDKFIQNNIKKLDLNLEDYNGEVLTNLIINNENPIEMMKKIFYDVNLISKITDTNFYFLIKDFPKEYENDLILLLNDISNNKNLKKILVKNKINLKSYEKFKKI